MLAHVGPITRTVRDAALMLSVIAGHDPRDPNAVPAPVPDFSGSLDAGIAGLRIGWCPSFGYGRADAQVLARCAEAALALAAHGAQVEEVPPPFARDPGPAWNHMFYGRIAQRLAELAPTPERMALVNRALREAAAHEQSAAALDDAQAEALRMQVLAEAQDLFRRVDVLLTPTLPVTALPVEVDVPRATPAAMRSTGPGSPIPSTSPDTRLPPSRSAMWTACRWACSSWPASTASAPSCGWRRCWSSCTPCGCRASTRNYSSRRTTGRARSTSARSATTRRTPGAGSSGAAGSMLTLPMPNSAMSCGDSA
ncbi:hypothetical protein HK415_17235 [Ramlibacter sp. B156]|uniref:Amidase domain-containing protein n=1 Tax=Ramlibacter montanisoli TaxID=2732512 RepID=A0A849KEB7_9BURK|nr:hypothetical protein [Ramlibacter montanisoli]